MMSQVRALYPQFGTLAQLVEHLVEAQGVAGSSPAGSITLAPLEQRSARRPVTAKVTGSNPVWCVIAEELPPDKMSWNLYYCRTRVPRPLFCDKNTRGKRN